MAVDPAARAVGQHLDPQSQQRGLLGISAALRVITAGGADAVPIFTRGLAHYLEHAAKIEGKVDEDVRKSQSRLLGDDANVIKQSELLYSLARMKEAQRRAAGATEIAQRVADKLESGKASSGSGWSYLMSGPGSLVDPLPTACAVLALHEYGRDVTSESDELLRQLREDAIRDPFVRVFVLYVLAFSSKHSSNRRELRSILNAAWPSIVHLMDKDLEANIEYLAFGEHVGYIRVPWQLYLIALSARLSPLRRFASPAVQSRLAAALKSVSSSGTIIYPYSGAFASTRTNAILHEVLENVREDLRSWPGRIAAAPMLPTLSRLWRSSALLWTARIVAAALVAASLFYWKVDGASIAGMAGNFASTFILGALMWRPKR